MKVLLITSYGPALINFRRPLIVDLIQAGHEVVVAAPAISMLVREKLEEVGAVVEHTPLKRTGLNPVGDANYLFHLVGLGRRQKPDVLLSFTIKPNVWGALSAAVIHVPSVAVLTGLGYAFTNSDSRKQKLIACIARWLYRAATRLNQAVIFQNPDDQRDFIAARCLSDPTKAFLVNGSGVDLLHYRRVALPDEVTFLMIARLIGNKGVREYAAAAAIVKKVLPESRFLLVGDQDEGLDGIPQREIDAWNANGVEYLGPVADVRAVISKASVFVLPSYREGTPRSVLEAMAMGRPIITTDAPGCRETVQDRVNGFLVPVRDTKKLGLRMLELAKNPQLRASFGTKSYEFAKDKFEVSIVNKKMIQVLENVT